MKTSLKSVLRKDPSPQQIIGVLPDDDESAVNVVRLLIPYAVKHPEIVDMIGGNTLIGILLLIHKRITAPNPSSIQGLVEALQDMLMDIEDNIFEDVITLLLEWRDARQRRMIMNLYLDQMKSVFPNTFILEDSPRARTLYKKLYNLIVKRRTLTINERADVLGDLYYACNWNEKVGKVIYSCLKNDPLLVQNDHGRVGFFILIMIGMDKIYPKIMRLMKRGDLKKVFNVYMKYVMEIMSKKQKTADDYEELDDKRQVLIYLFGMLPKKASDEEVVRMISGRNKEFVEQLQAVLGGIRHELRTRIGVPKNLPNFNQLRTLTRKKIIRNDQLADILTSRIDDLQAQIQRHRHG